VRIFCSKTYLLINKLLLFLPLTHFEPCSALKARLYVHRATVTDRPVMYVHRATVTDRPVMYVHRATVTDRPVMYV